MKTIFRYLLGLFMVLVGITHFTSPGQFVRIVPSYLPWPETLVYVSGAFEILGGVGILIARLRYMAAVGLIVLYVAVLPANVNMAIHQIPFGDHATPSWFLWARLPMQLVLIGWAWWIRK